MWGNVSSRTATSTHPDSGSFKTPGIVRHFLPFRYLPKSDSASVRAVESGCLSGETSGDGVQP